MIPDIRTSKPNQTLAWSVVVCGHVHLRNRYGPVLQQEDSCNTSSFLDACRLQVSPLSFYHGVQLQCTLSIIMQPVVLLAASFCSWK